MARISDATLNELKAACFRNAIRLFSDGCSLFARESWSTACALGILCYEEVGKLLILERVYDDISINPGEELRDEFIGWLTGGMLTDHRRKQVYAHLDGAPMRLEARAIDAGALEQLKWRCLYVSLDGARVGTPQRVGRDQAASVLKDALKAIESVASLAYTGVDGFDSDQSAWQAQRDLKIAAGAFEECGA